MAADGFFIPEIAYFIANCHDLKEEPMMAREG